MGYPTIVNEIGGLDAKKAWQMADKIGDSLSDEGDELLMYLQNDGQLYRQRTVPIEKNLKRKADNSKFDIKLAPKLWMNLVNDAVKKYAKEFGVQFSKQDRMMVAEYLTYEWVAKYLDGEYN